MSHQTLLGMQNITFSLAARDKATKRQRDWAYATPQQILDHRSRDNLFSNVAKSDNILRSCVVAMSQKLSP